MSKMQKLETEIEAAFLDCGYGVCVEDLVMTQETIEDFKSARKNYSEIGRIVTDSDNVFIVESIQVRKSESRKDLCVIDFGSFRVVYN